MKKHGDGILIILHIITLSRHEEAGDYKASILVLIPYISIVGVLLLR